MEEIAPYSESWRKPPLSVRAAQDLACFFGGGGGGGPSKAQIKSQEREAAKDRAAAAKQQKELQKQTQIQQQQFQAQLAAQRQQLQILSKQQGNIDIPSPPQPAPPPPQRVDYTANAQTARDKMKKRRAQFGLAATVVAGESSQGTLGSTDGKGKKLLG